MVLIIFLHDLHCSPLISRWLALPSSHSFSSSSALSLFGFPAISERSYITLMAFSHAASHQEPHRHHWRSRPKRMEQRHSMIICKSDL